MNEKPWYYGLYRFTAPDGRVTVPFSKEVYAWSDIESMLNSLRATTKIGLEIAQGTGEWSGNWLIREKN
jgi:hypothetical protein